MSFRKAVVLGVCGYEVYYYLINFFIMLFKKFHRHAYFHPHQLIRYLLVQTLSLNMINYNSYNYD